MKMKMKVPCCSVCQTRYNEKERVPLLLHCGHGFCKECLSRMFAASTDTTLSCPRCRHVSVVGNSVTALRKNFAVLQLILSATSAKNSNLHHGNNHNNNSGSNNNFDSDVTDDDDDDDDDEEEDDEERYEEEVNYEDGDVRLRLRGRGSHSSSGLRPLIEVGPHTEVKLVKKLGDGRRAGVDVWGAWIGGTQRKGKHGVAVKRVGISEEMEVDWVYGQLENLRRASMWCRNVCTFHGVVRMDGCLGLVMDRCYGSVQLAMQRNEGRLTLEQILRFCFAYLLDMLGMWNVIL